MKRRAHLSVILLPLVNDYGNNRRQLAVYKDMLLKKLQSLQSHVLKHLYACQGIRGAFMFKEHKSWRIGFQNQIIVR